MPGRRFTYSQRYNSATVDPGDIPWKTNARSSSTSTFWNISTSKSKVHPNHPDEARVEELRKVKFICKYCATEEKYTWDKDDHDHEPVCLG